MTSARLSAPVTSDRAPFAHRGFELHLSPADGAFAFEVSHHGLTLHASDATFGSIFAAERAARLFVDDALGAFDAASAALAA